MRHIRGTNGIIDKMLVEAADTPPLLQLVKLQATTPELNVKQNTTPRTRCFTAQA
jgi:hypothetical protein